jgi:hypothetical protein
MDIRSARIVLKVIQECFKEYDHTFPRESNKEHQVESSDCLTMRAYVTRDDYLAYMVTSLWLDSEVIQLSMFFHDEVPEAILPGFLELISDINMQTGGYYWTKTQRQRKVEFRTAFLLSEGQLNKAQFKAVLEKFLKMGLWQYSNFRKLMVNSRELIN